MRATLAILFLFPLGLLAQWGGGNGRGDAAVIHTPTPIASSIFSGGDGRGDIAAVFAPAPIASSIFSGGNGRGDIAAVFSPTPIASSIFSGGNGRGDIAALFAPTPIASSIFSGGNGRGDIAALFAPAPIASSIFSGGNGRGDVAALFLPTTIPSNIYSGGIGRGDVAQLFTVGADTYYSRANGNVTDPIWSTWRTGAPGPAIWGPGSSMVVQVGNTVTNTANVSVQKVDVETGGTLVLNSNTTFSVWGSNATFTGTLTTQDNSTLALRSTTTPVALATTGTPSIYDLTVNTGSGTTVTGNADIRGTLLLEKGVFNASTAAITLRSTATYTGRLGPVAAVASYAGNLKMERYIPAGATNWRLLGSPVGGNTVNNWQDDFITAGYPGSPYPNFDNPVGSGIIWPSVRWYNETNPGPLVNDGLVGATSNLQPLAMGQGFAAWSGSGFTTTTAFVVDVTGPPNVAAAPVSLPMSWTNTGTPTVDGWNLVSNPLPSPIAFDQIARGANVEDYITYFNPINGNTAVYDISLGGGTNLGTNTIQSSQGFWLKTNGPAVTTTVDEADKILSNTGGLFGGDEESTLQALRLKASSALNAYTDETLVVFNAGEPELEGEDVPKYVFAHPEAPQIATKADGGEWIAINAYGSYDMAATIPVIVDVAVTGNYTITASGLENLGLTCLVLEDESTGVYTPLLEGSTYTFTMNAAADASAPRFFLHASVPVELEVSDATCATTGNGSAVVEFQGAGTTEATWTNAAGDVLQQGPLENGFSVLEGLGAGAYNVSVTSDAGCGNLQQSFTIEAPWAMEATAQTAPASCANTADGSVSVEVLGGVAPYSYLWSNAATTATLTAGAGTYTVEVTDANGCLFTPTAYTIVHNGPVAGFTAESTVLVNDPLVFTNTSTPGAEYLWDFGDGESSEEVSPEHMWTTPGTYTVTLTVTSGSCTTTASQTVIVETTTVIATATPLEDLHAWLANDQFIIDHPFNNGLPVVVEVLDAAGHLVQRHQAPGYPGRILLPADGLASGIWLLRISNAEEQHILRIPVLR